MHAPHNILDRFYVYLTIKAAAIINCVAYGKGRVRVSDSQKFWQKRIARIQIIQKKCQIKNACLPLSFGEKKYFVLNPSYNKYVKNEGSQTHTLFLKELKGQSLSFLHMS